MTPILMPPGSAAPAAGEMATNRPRSAAATRFCFMAVAMLLDRASRRETWAGNVSASADRRHRTLAPGAPRQSVAPAGGGPSLVGFARWFSQVIPPGPDA